MSAEEKSTKVTWSQIRSWYSWVATSMLMSGLNHWYPL